MEEEVDSQEEDIEENANLPDDQILDGTPREDEAMQDLDQV